MDIILRVAMVHPSEKALKQYMGEHPKANPKNHTVKQTKKRYQAVSKDEVARAKQVAKDTSWHKPDINEEIGEVERTADDLGVDKKKLVSAAKRGELETLDDKTWSRMENTDSYDTDTIEKAAKLAEEYDRDIRSVVKGMGGKLPAPIVLIRKGKAPYLIGGNTRLMTSRAFGVKPKVLMVRV